MAMKKTVAKKATTSEKTRALMNRAYDLRTIKKINATPAEKAKQTRQSIDASRTAARAEAIANREDKKKAAKAAAKKASYSPKPMSAFAKEKAAMRGAATQAKIKNPAGLKQMNLDKVTKRVGPTKSAFTPEQKAYLKKMLSQGGRLDK